MFVVGLETTEAPGEIAGSFDSVIAVGLATIGRGGLGTDLSSVTSVGCESEPAVIAAVNTETTIQVSPSRLSHD